MRIVVLKVSILGVIILYSKLREPDIRTTLGNVLDNVFRLDSHQKYYSMNIVHFITCFIRVLSLSYIRNG